MSTEVYDQGGLYVTRLAGPASEGADRRRWELFTPHEPVRLTAAEVRTLVLVLLAELLDR